MSKKALGRGLKALIPDEGFDSGSKEEEQEQAQDGSIGSLPVEKIRTNPFQPHISLITHCLIIFCIARHKFKII